MTSPALHGRHALHSSFVARRHIPLALVARSRYDSPLQCQKCPALLSDRDCRSFDSMDPCSMRNSSRIGKLIRFTRRQSRVGTQRENCSSFALQCQTRGIAAHSPRSPPLRSCTSSFLSTLPSPRPPRSGAPALIRSAWQQAPQLRHACRVQGHVSVRVLPPVSVFAAFFASVFGCVSFFSSLFRGTPRPRLLLPPVFLQPLRPRGRRGRLRLRTGHRKQADYTKPARRLCLDTPPLARREPRLRSWASLASGDRAFNHVCEWAGHFARAPPDNLAAETLKWLAPLRWRTCGDVLGTDWRHGKCNWPRSPQDSVGLSSERLGRILRRIGRYGSSVKHPWHSGNPRVTTTGANIAAVGDRVQPFPPSPSSPPSHHFAFQRRSPASAFYGRLPRQAPPVSRGTSEVKHMRQQE